MNLLVERTLIKNGIVVTMDDAGTIYDDGAVVLEQDKIVAVGKTGDI